MGLEIIGLNIATIAGALAVLLFLLGLMRMYPTKSARKTANMFAVIGLIVFAIPAFVTPVSLLTNPLGASGGVQVASVSPSAVSSTNLGCLQTTATTVTIAGVDAYTGVAAGGTHRVRVNDGPPKEVADAGTLSVSPGDKVEVVFENASVGGSYYSDRQEFTVGCVPTQTLSDKLYGNGTITITGRTATGDTISVSGGVNQTIGANNDEKNVKVLFQGQSQKGTPSGSYVVLEYNGTTIQTISSDLPTAPKVPSAYAISNTDGKTAAFLLPAVNGIGEQTATFTIRSTSINPPAIGSDVTVTLMPNNWYYDKNDGNKEKLGPEDWNNVGTGLSRTAYTIQVD